MKKPGFPGFFRVLHTLFIPFMTKFYKKRNCINF